MVAVKGTRLFAHLKKRQAAFQIIFKNFVITTATT